MESSSTRDERAALLKKRNNSHISIAINALEAPALDSQRSPSDYTYIHTFSTEEVYHATKSRHGGLTNLEVAERIKIHGLNTIKRKAGKSLILKFLSNFTHLMAILLWSAAIIGFIAETPQIAVAICLVNIINGMFSFWQEFKAEKATEALRNLLPTFMNVLRENGERTKIVAEKLVVGDVIILEEGDRISADACLVDAAELYIDQSTLTGESLPTNKQTRDELLSTVTSMEKLQSIRRLEAQNIVFAGTSVVSGTGKAVVYATGMNSELGKIAHLTQTFTESLSPLQKEMHKITKTVTALAVSVGAILFLLAYLLARV